MIDTGASNSCVDKTRADYFNLEAEGDNLPLQGAGQEKLFAQSSRKSSLYYLDHEIYHLNFMLIDMNTINAALAEQEEENIDGIIGADILYKKKAVIDYDQCCLYLNESSWFYSSKAFLGSLPINNSTGFSKASFTATKNPTDSRPSTIL